MIKILSKVLCPLSLQLSGFFNHSLYFDRFYNSPSFLCLRYIHRKMVELLTEPVNLNIMQSRISVQSDAAMRCIQISLAFNRDRKPFLIRISYNRIDIFGRIRYGYVCFIFTLSFSCLKGKNRR